MLDVILTILARWGRVLSWNVSSVWTTRSCTVGISTASRLFQRRHVFLNNVKVSLVVVTHSRPNQNAASAVSVMFCYGYRNITLADSPSYTFTPVVEINVVQNAIRLTKGCCPTDTFSNGDDDGANRASQLLPQARSTRLPADLSRFRTVRGWIAPAAAHRRLIFR